MQAVILAGGRGTRLRPLTVHTPKPVVPVLNKPFLFYQIEILRRAGIDNITLSLSYQPNKIEQSLGDGAALGVKLRYITEPFPMGTGGAYKFAAADIKETTVVFNGDILTDLDITKVIELHRAKNSAATLTLFPVENPQAYGLVETEPDGKIRRFLEKPDPNEFETLPTNNINAGIYILEPEILEIIPQGENYSFEYNVFPDILKQRKPFYAYVMQNNYWRDIGTPQSYLDAHEDFLSGKIKNFEIEKNEQIKTDATANIDTKSILGNDCEVGANARIIGSVLGANVRVGENAVVENSVIWENTEISSHAQIRRAVVGRNCKIEKNAVISDGTLLGDETRISEHSRC